jgi:hypothetical protein
MEIGAPRLYVLSIHVIPIVVLLIRWVNNTILVTYFSLMLRFSRTAQVKCLTKAGTIGNSQYAA